MAAAPFSANIMELIAAFVVDRHGLSADDAQAWLDDLRARAEEGNYLFSLNRYVFLAAVT